MKSFVRSVVTSNQLILWSLQISVTTRLGGNFEPARRYCDTVEGYSARERNRLHIKTFLKGTRVIDVFPFQSITEKRPSENL